MTWNSSDYKWINAWQCLFFRQLLVLLFFFWSALDLSCCMRTLSCGLWAIFPWPGIEPGPSALGARRLSCWTTREDLPDTFESRRPGLPGGLSPSIHSCYVYCPPAKGDWIDICKFQNVFWWFPNMFLLWYQVFGIQGLCLPSDLDISVTSWSSRKGAVPNS